MDNGIAVDLAYGIALCYHALQTKRPPKHMKRHALLHESKMARSSPRTKNVERNSKYY